MQASVSQDSQPGLLQKIKRIGMIVIIGGLIIFLILFFYGSQDVHSDVVHNLYDCFEHSPEHVELLQKLTASQLSIIYGKKQAGIFQFAEHYANNLSLAGRNVFVEDISKSHFRLYKVAQAARKRMDKWFGIEKEKGDWFIYSRDGNLVPYDLIDKLRHGNHHSKITIVTTSPRQRNRGFKQFAFPELDEHQIEESIERNFEVNENTADILFDYFETQEKAFQGMKFQTFSHQQFLGDNYRSLDGLTKEDNRILKDLCKKGEGHSERQSLALTELGVVYYMQQNYWMNAEARLNYELHKNLNCKNKLISEDMLKLAQDIRERDAQEARQRQQRQDARKKNKKKSKK